MTSLKDIQNAIKAKQKGLNADIETLIRISKENEQLKRSIEEEDKQKEINYKDALIKLGVKLI